MNRMQIFAGITVLATTVALFPGCSGEIQTASTENTGSEECNHIIINFGNQPVIFRECEGYTFDLHGINGCVDYKIISDGDILIYGSASDYNYYLTDHEQVEEIEQEAIENGAYVFKLQK